MARTKKQGGPDQVKEEFWRSEVNGWRRSGMSVRAWCRQRQLSEPSFYAWRRMLAQRDEGATHTAPTFVTVTAHPPGMSAVGGGAVLELVHRAGHVLRIGPACDANTLAMVLAALAGTGEAARC